MTPEDRELLEGMRRQQLELRQALARLDAQMDRFEARAGTAVAEPHDLPPIPEDMHHPHLPPIPVQSQPSFPPLPPIPPPPPVPKPRHTFEFQFGRWMIGIGGLCAVIIFVLVVGIEHARISHLLGASGKIFLSAAISLIVINAGGYLERRRPFIGRVVTGVALTWLYLTTYSASYSDRYQIVHSSLVAGLLLILWAIYTLLVADRRRSQAIALLAISLAYYSTAINSIGRFTMAADLFLAGSAVFLLIRKGWAGVAYISLFGSYLAMLRRLVIDADGEFVFDSGRILHFWPYAFYLTFTWMVFTGAVWLCGAPTFRGEKRLAFLSLNNAAWAGLLLFTAYISGYGHGTMGWILLLTGGVLLITSRFVGWTDIEPEKVMAAYAAQGLGLFTGGVIVIFTGITRGVMLTLETLLTGCAGTFSSDRVLLVTTSIAGFFATAFLSWEIAVNAHHPWLLGFGGALVMLINAHMARSDIRHSMQARSTIVPGSYYYCCLAVALVFTAICARESEIALPPALAFAALALTFVVYYFSIFELPAIAQAMLLCALAMVIFPIDTGEALPWWTTTGVTLATLVLVTWWARQKTIVTGGGIQVLIIVYALALATLAYEIVRPWADLDGWMGLASLLSVLFLLWGAFTRVWQIAAVGQLFLAIALYHFFIPPGESSFPWRWWAALAPLAVVFATARATHFWLDQSREEPDLRQKSLRLLAYGYQLLALAMVIRWVSASSVIVPLEQVAIFFFLGTFVLAWNVRHPSLFGVRCSYVLTALGFLLYLENIAANAVTMATLFNAMAFLCFLIQPALVRRHGRFKVTKVESWTLILGSVGAGLFFVTDWVEVHFSASSLTMSWTLYGLFLFLMGPIVRERRLRWCGLAVLVVAIGRAMFHDFWHISIGYQILTAIALMVTTLSVGYLITQSAEKFKK